MTFEFSARAWRQRLGATLSQLHWCLGITAGTLLILIGLSGAVLSLEDEWLDGLNPGVRTVPDRGEVPDAAKILAALPLLDTPVSQLVLHADTRRAVEVQLQGPRGRVPTHYVDPVDGRWLGPARGDEFFETVERLHRFLLLPREQGRLYTGVLACALLVLVISGLWLRWPARPGRWRSWFTFDPNLRGRPLLWSLHAVIATWALPFWLIVASTGIYWSFDPVRQWVDTQLGVQRERVARVSMKAGVGVPALPDLSRAWDSFRREVPDWREARVRLPAHPGAPVEIQWLARDATHPRERNRFSVDLAGAVQRDERHAEAALGVRVQAAIYPLHMGSYWGMPGRVVMGLAALALAWIGLSGWWLYLQRRRRRSQVRMQRIPGVALAPGQQGLIEDAIVVAWASQTGRAEALAVQTAQQLSAAGQAVRLVPLAGWRPEQLAECRQILFVVSTYGEGQAPDAARGFAESLEQASMALPQLRYAVLALGNRHYAHFCGFGQGLHQRLVEMGALSWQPPVLLDEGEAPTRWVQTLSRWGVMASQTPASSAPERWERWRLSQRVCLNPASLGGPLYLLTLAPSPGPDIPVWTPGALVEVREPLPGGVARRYSVASIAEDGVLQLLVRQHRHAGGVGRMSAYLTESCALHEEILVRWLPNPAFTLPASAMPCFFIGAGSGLAGLRGLLRARLRAGQGPNWLFYGERQRSADHVLAQEFDAAVATGLLRVDRAYSRDPQGEYVQDRLRAHAEEIRAWVSRGACVYVCGSLQGMASGVDQALRELLGEAGLRQLMDGGRYRRDVY